jgi:hypothetical protein
MSNVMNEQIRHLQERLKEAERQLDIYREALFPFANCDRAMRADGLVPGQDGVGVFCRASDFTRAAELLFEQ